MRKRKETQNNRLSRREFIAASSAALIGLGMKSERPIAGGFVNESFQLGHMLRDHKTFPAATQKEKVSIVIVGGGMAGLSAAWHLDRRGFRDFVLLEMEQQPGGNSRWGENEVSRYPWAAHYLPVPDKNETLVRELMEELGALKDGRWEERYLCFTPQERLFIHGRWQDGIEPSVGLNPADREQFKRFNDLLEQFRATGEFTIPTQRGIQTNSDPKIRALDQLSVTAWLEQQKLDSNYLRWYLDYACRDDYGAPASATSAWAGIHYFASREHEEKGPLTWPEGNGWIARQLISKLDRYIRRGAMTHRIEPMGSKNAKNKWRVLAGDTEYTADAVIFAAPTFLAPYLVEGVTLAMTPDIQYSPWFTANLTLDRWPRELEGGEPAWDNVIYNSKSLGYVVANHQSVRQHEERSVWTYYWAMAEDSPRESRKRLLANDWPYFKELILTDLQRVHTDIRECVSGIDIMRMGHAMVRPTVGSMFDDNRRKLADTATLPKLERLFFANSDLSGISIFENAQWNGVQAANHALHSLGRG